MSPLKLKSLLLAFATYFVLIIAIILGLYQHKEPIKAKNYTAKKSDAIEVSLGAPVASKTPTLEKKKQNSAKKLQKKQEKKRKKPIKKVRNTPKKPIKKPKKVVRKSPKKSKKKKKIVKKKVIKKAQKTQKVKKANTNKLFKSIGQIKNNKPSQSQKGNSGKAQTKRNQSKGIENRYFAKIQNTLRGWPAQSNFAGEKIRVELIVYQSGLFDYKILYKSLNPEFNEALKNYLEQLRRVGFGMHSNPKPYKIIVEFIAK